MNNESNATPHQAAGTVPWPTVTAYPGGASEEGCYAWLDVRLTDGPETTRFVHSSLHQAAEPAPSEQQAAFAKAQRWLECRDWKLDGDYFVKIGHCETMGVDAVALIVGAVLEHVAASPAPRAVAEPAKGWTQAVVERAGSTWLDITAPDGRMIQLPWTVGTIGAEIMRDFGAALSAAPAPTPSEDARMLDWLERASADALDESDIWATWPNEYRTLREAIRAAMSADSKGKAR